MSIQSEIDRIENNIAATYAELEEQGATMPSARNSTNLAATAATTKTVKYIAQTLTAAQQAQARANIGAVSEDELPNAFYVTVTGSPDSEYATTDKSLAEIIEAYNSGKPVYCKYFVEEGSDALIAPLVVLSEGIAMFTLFTDQVIAIMVGDGFAMVQSISVVTDEVLQSYMTNVVKAVDQDLDDQQKWQARDNINAAGHFYGVCSTAASTAAKEVTVDSSFALVAGAQVTVKFINANSASSAPTLNVNGTGAKPLYRYGTTALSTGTTTTGWYAGSVQLFTYDGTGWIRDYWNNSIYSNASLGQGYATCSTAAATVAKTASLSSYALTVGGIVAVKFTNDVPAGATLNINSKGAKPIYYKGAAITADVIKAGDTATFIYSTNYHLISIDKALENLNTTSTQRDIYVDMLGIKRGDANAAATNSEILASLLASRSNGFTVHFGSGHYYFADPIVRDKYTVFKGVCSNACVYTNKDISLDLNYGTYLHFPDLADGEAAIELTAGGVVEDLGIVGNPSICNVSLDRSKTGTAPGSIVTLVDTGTTYGIKITGNYTVNNVRVRNCTYGIYSETTNAIISGVYAFRCKIGVSVGNDIRVTDVHVWEVMVGVELRGQLASATNIRGDSIGKHLIVCRKGKCLLTNIDGDYCVGSLIHYGLCGDGYDADNDANKYIHLGQAVACMGRVATKCAYLRSAGFNLANVADADYDSCSYISIAPDLQVFGGQIDVVNVAANPMDGSSNYLHPNAVISIGTGSTVKGVTVRCNIPDDADVAYFNQNVIKNLSTYAEATNDTRNYLTDFDGVTVEDISFITLSGFVRSVRTTSALDRQIKSVEIPTALPNPKALTFTGAVTESYDGSAAKSVKIPADVSGEVSTLSTKVTQMESVIEPMEVLVPGINLNDEVYEWGRFAAAGTEYNSDNPINQAFRNANYLPVEGGRTIAVYFDAYEWNKNNKYAAVFIVEYDANKARIGQRKEFKGYASNTTFTLDANTAYVRLSVYPAVAITTALTDIKMAMYYIEDAVKEYVPYGYGAEYTYGVKGSKVSLVSPNGTTYVLSVSDDGVLSAVLPVKE